MVVELSEEHRKRLGDMAQHRGLSCQLCASTEFEGYSASWTAEEPIIASVLCKYCGLEVSLELSKKEAQQIHLT